MPTSSPVYRRPGSRFWWCRVLVDGKIVRRSTKCRDEKAAIAAWRRFEREAVDPADRPAPEATLDDCLGRLIADRRDRGRAEGTIEMHTQKGRWLCQHFGAQTNVSKIDAPSVDRYIELRRADGAKSSTIHKELVTLRGVLRVAARRGEYRGDWRAVLPVGFSPEYEPRTTSLTPEQFAALVAELPAGQAAVVCFYVATGARRAECLRAQRVDVDLEGGFVHLRGTKTANARRSVPVTPLGAPLLERALADADGPEPSEEDPAPTLFYPWPDPYKALQRACQRAGVPRVTPNDLRRTFTTWLQERGVDHEHLAKLLGHGSTTMVDRVYGRARPTALRELVLARLTGTDSAQSSAKAHEEPEEADDAEGLLIRRSRVRTPWGPRENKDISILAGPTGPVAIACSGTESTHRPIRKCGPPSLYSGVREPRTVGELLDLALSLGVRP